MDISEIGQGDIIVLDIAVFHRSGVDGACHVEKEIEYLIHDELKEDTLCILTVEQEEMLDSSIVGNIRSLRLDFTNGKEAIKNHDNVFNIVGFREG